MGDEEMAKVLDLTKHPLFRANLLQRIATVAITLKRELTGDMDLFADIAVSADLDLSTDWLCGLTFHLVIRLEDGRRLKFDGEYRLIKEDCAQAHLHHITIGPLREAGPSELAPEDERLPNCTGNLIIVAGEEAERHFSFSVRPTPIP